MIKQYLVLEGNVRKKAEHIGKLLLHFRHYGITLHSQVRVVQPFLHRADESAVLITVGFNQEGGRVNIAVPVQLFESASDENIRSWIDSQNTAYLAAIKQDKLQEDDIVKTHELQILHELMEKYPNEVQ